MYLNIFLHVCYVTRHTILIPFSKFVVAGQTTLIPFSLFVWINYTPILLDKTGQTILIPFSMLRQDIFNSYLSPYLFFCDRTYSYHSRSCDRATNCTPLRQDKLNLYTFLHICLPQDKLKSYPSSYLFATGQTKLIPFLIFVCHRTS